MSNYNYTCNKCGKTVRVRSKGLCSFCRSKELKGLKKTVKTAKSDGIGNFFKKHIKRLEANPYSFLSGRYISNPSSVNIAHILPKRAIGGFPSLAQDDRNVVYLTYKEHTRFDELLNKGDYASIKKYYKKIFDKMEFLFNIASENNKMKVKFKKFKNEDTSI